MSTDEPNEPESPADGPDDTFEAVLASYIDRLSRGEVFDETKILSEHPELGQEVWEHLQLFHSVGGTSEGETPEGRIGGYTLKRRIGRGGMGVVYEAWEHSMDRAVALKVLPSVSCVDDRAVARFVREARVAGRLNHPNVVPVYSMGVHEGAPYFAMEYVEGETLSRIIARFRGGARGGRTDSEGRIIEFHLDASRDEQEGAPPSRPDERPSTSAALAGGDITPEYCFQVARAFIGVADALHYAHAKRIIHRDIKPSNLILDGEGRLRILDFGLARIEGQETLTATGDLMGTPLYMSPEQAMARRLPIDHRTDIYSLGATLYEALAWKPPFQGRTFEDTLSSIIFRDPAPLRSIQAAVPRDLETIVFKCIEKKPEDRYGTAEALAQDLRRFVRGDPIEARPQPAVRKALRRMWRIRARIAAVGAVIVALAALGMVWALWPEARPALTAPRQLTFDPGVTIDPSISSDGSIIAYASDRATGEDLDIWVERRGGSKPWRLTSTRVDESAPALSADGQWVAYRSEGDGGGIWVVPSQETERADAILIARGGRDPRFSPDGQMIAYWVGAKGGAPEDSVCYVVSFRGGEPRRLGSDLLGAKYPIWSPRGHRILCVGGGTEKHPAADWFQLDLEGGSSRPSGVYPKLREIEVPVLDTGLRLLRPDDWLESGWVVFSAISGASECLWAVRVSPDHGRIIGEPRRLTFGTAREVNPRVSLGGELLFSSIASDLDVWGVPLDADNGKISGALARLTEHPGLENEPSISVDGTRIAFASTRSGGQSVYYKDLADPGEPRLVAPRRPDGVAARRACIRRDGRGIAYESMTRPRTVMYVDLSGESPSAPRELAAGVWHPRGWAPDGSFVICSRWSGPKGGSEVVRVDRETGEVSLLARREGFNVWNASPSLDGRWIACNLTGIDDPRSRVSVFEYHLGHPPGPEDWIDSEEGSWWEDKPKWAPGGRLLYFTSDRDGYRCVWARPFDPEAGRFSGSSFVVLECHETRLSMQHMSLNALQIDVARDRLVLNLESRAGNIWSAHLETSRWSDVTLR